MAAEFLVGSAGASIHIPSPLQESGTQVNCFESSAHVSDRLNDRTRIALRRMRLPDGLMGWTAPAPGINMP